MQSTPDETGPRPKSEFTTDELGDAIWTFYQNGCCMESENISALLNILLTAGKLELAMELLRFKELYRISSDIERIKEFFEEDVVPSLDSIAASVAGISSQL